MLAKGLGILDVGCPLHGGAFENLKYAYMDAQHMS
jgi:hypothetical protein